MTGCDRHRGAMWWPDLIGARAPRVARRAPHACSRPFQMSAPCESTDLSQSAGRKLRGVANRVGSQPRPKLTAWPATLRVPRQPRGECFARADELWQGKPEQGVNIIVEFGHSIRRLRGLHGLSLDRNREASRRG